MHLLLCWINNQVSCGQISKSSHKHVSGFLCAAAAVLDAIKAGQLSHIFLVGGCDAPEPSRKYYTDVVKGLPQDTMVLTLGCGKYRFYDQDLGTLANGLPRLLDMGQVRGR
jgi:hydroxylamine reductase